MKTSPIPTIAVLTAVASLSGCVTQPLPKDSYLKGVTSKVVTPWGTGEMHIDEAATGTAARNATKPDGSMVKP